MKLVPDWRKRFVFSTVRLALSIIQELDIPSDILEALYNATNGVREIADLDQALVLYGLRLDGLREPFVVRLVMNVYICSKQPEK